MTKSYLFTIFFYIAIKNDEKEINMVVSDLFLIFQSRITLNVDVVEKLKLTIVIFIKLSIHPDC